MYCNSFNILFIFIVILLYWQTINRPIIFTEIVISRLIVSFPGESKFHVSLKTGKVFKRNRHENPHQKCHGVPVLIIRVPVYIIIIVFQ